MQSATYEVETYGPIFYSSIEGELIKTDKFLSSTALSYAIGYAMQELDKYYVLTGDESVEPDYSPIKSLPYFLSDLKPVEVYVDEMTFRSTSYTEEYNITTGDRSVAERLDADCKYAYPKIRNKSDAGWHRLRYYSGISPDSEYEFTIWSSKNLPEELRFEMGIKRTGYIQATKKEKADTVDLNEYILSEVYDVMDDYESDILSSSAKYYPANDRRISRYVDVDIDLAEEIVSENELYKDQN